jgi:aminomethyltransferase
MHHTPLYDEHLRAGAKTVDFNGWALPIQFAGIVKEHVHTRERVSIFDCSHMGEYTVTGADAIRRYDRQIISDVSGIPVGRCRYGAILNEQGGILDDLITFRMGPEELYVVTNAGPLESVTKRLCGDNPGAKHVSFETAKIDVQGPLAREMVLRAGFIDAEGLKYFNATWTTWRGQRVLLSRTGYTGELGYELFMPNDLAVEMWRTFLDMDEIEPAGLGARDTLRTEVGYNLSGQDFDSSWTPLESAMESFIAWDTEFVGKAALEKKRAAGDWMRLVGIVTHTKQKPQHGFEVKHEGKAVGEVTSGTYGPSVGHGVGLARVPAALSAAGTRLPAGPRDVEIEVATPPFYRHGTCRVDVSAAANPA